MERRVRAKLLLRLVGILVSGLVLPRAVYGIWDAATAVRWSAIQSRIIFDVVRTIADQLSWASAWPWAIRYGPAWIAMGAAMYLLLGGTRPFLRPLERRLNDG